MRKLYYIGGILTTVALLLSHFAAMVAGWMLCDNKHQQKRR